MSACAAAVKKSSAIREPLSLTFDSFTSIGYIPAEMRRAFVTLNLYAKAVLPLTSKIIVLFLELVSLVKLW
jgi:hypothetical protein